MRKIILFILALTALCRVQAQPVGRFEGEAAAAVLFGTVTKGATVEGTWNFLAEGRYNFRSLPLDVGVQFFLGAFARDWDGGRLSDNQHFKIYSVVADWNFGRTARVMPFVGCAVGVAAVKIDRSDMRAERTFHDTSLCVMPRVGIEFFHRVRLTAGYRWMKRDYRCCEVALGVVFGGGVRKSPGR